MGWGGGGSIFDRVAKGLIDAGASDEIKRQVLGPLIDELQQSDWDTEGESLRLFSDDPVIVDIFRKCGVTLDPDLDDEEV